MSASPFTPSMGKGRVDRFLTYKLPLFVLLPYPVWSEAFLDSYKKTMPRNKHVLKRVLPTVNVTIDAHGDVTATKIQKPVKGAVNAGLLSYNEKSGGHIVYYEVNNDNVYVYDPNGRTAIVDGNLTMDIDITMNVMVPDLDACYTIISELKAKRPAKRKRRLLTVKDWDMVSPDSPIIETQEDNEPLDIYKAIAEYNEFVIECNMTFCKEVTKKCMPAIRRAVKIQSGDTVPIVYEPKMSAVYTELSLDSDGVSGMAFTPNRPRLNNPRLARMKTVSDIQKRLTFRLGLTISPKPDLQKDEFALTLNTYMQSKIQAIQSNVNALESVVNVTVHAPCIVRNKEDPLLKAIDHVFVGKQINFQPVPALNFAIGKDSKIVSLMKKLFPDISTKLFTMPGVCATIAMHYMCTFVENNGVQVSDGDKLLYTTNYLYVPRDASDVFVILTLMQLFYSRVRAIAQGSKFREMCNGLMHMTVDELNAIEARGTEEQKNIAGMLVLLSTQVAGDNTFVNDTHIAQVQTLVHTLFEEQVPIQLILNGDRLVNNDEVYVGDLDMTDRRTSVGYKVESTNNIPFCD